jgi:hypothetical protein
MDSLSLLSGPKFGSLPPLRMDIASKAKGIMIFKFAAMVTENKRRNPFDRFMVLPVWLFGTSCLSVSFHGSHSGGGKRYSHWHHAKRNICVNLSTWLTARDCPSGCNCTSCNCTKHFIIDRPVDVVLIPTFPL